MTRHGLLCLLLGALAWGQAAPQKTKPAAPAAAPAATAPKAAAPQSGAPAEESKAVEVPMDTPVVTISGLCDKPAAASSPDCKTTITRAQFEKLVEAVQPNLPPRARRQFAARYADALAMSMKAEQMGLDKTPIFQERMKLARTQVLAQELGKALQEKAGNVSDQDIQDYYQKNLSNFEQADMDRVYIPKTKQMPEADEEKGETEKKLTEVEEEKQEKESEAAMKDAADKLHSRAAAGEDFAKLQEAAYEAAGIKSGSPSANLAKTRRSMLPASQVSVMDMKPGEISPLITDQNGYFIYKLKSKTTMPLEEAREEIHNTLRSQRIQEEMKAVQESAKPSFDEKYFGPEANARGPMMGRPGMPPMPRTQPPSNGPQ